MAKATANYANSQLIKMEAVLDGYSEGIALDATGFVSEGSGQNLFIVRDERAVHAARNGVYPSGITRVIACAAPYSGLHSSAGPIEK